MLPGLGEDLTAFKVLPPDAVQVDGARLACAYLIDLIAVAALLQPGAFDRGGIPEADCFDRLPGFERPTG
ncbi:hypothetical protein [Streptomyces olivaceiscleroticus]|uniref:Uncharacterized protein n=1 Tax=Streptomyces olivaceiscleroticus TaxID=68245 RepID=A0ABP3JCA7_9ACTN